MKYKSNILFFLSFICLQLLMTTGLLAQNINLTTNDTKLSINGQGYFSSVNVRGKELLHAGQYPLVAVCSNGKLLLPEHVMKNGRLLTCILSDGGKVVLKYMESSVCITLAVVSIPEKYEVLLLAPLAVNINGVVGDIIGVVQGQGVAFGIQSLNIKTNAGIPFEYTDVVSRYFSVKGDAASVSTSTIPAYRLAATKISDGAMYQFSCRRRNQIEYRQIQQIAKSLTIPVEGQDALIKGAKIALFGSKDSEALDRIGAIEIEQHLPHPMFGNEWGKTSRSSMKSYLISDFNEEEFDLALAKCKRAGFQCIYHIEPFMTWGHFQWNPNFVKGGDEAVKALVDKAASQGIAVGIHTLSNFTTTNDAYVTPVPSTHLLKQGILHLTAAINASQTEIAIKKSDLFSMPMTLNAMQIENELITYGTAEINGDSMILHQCKRGAFGTTTAAHTSDKLLYKLWDYPYRTLFPDLILQDKFADRLVEIFNKTGLRQISFDGLEGCMYTGHDDYATARFVDRCFNGWDHNVLNDASNLNHFAWHIHTRMNWGEPWGEAMRTGQVESRIKNQDFFRRNLFPRMLGWFLIRLADKDFECTSLEDLEWAMSEAAGFDGGYAMTIYMKTIRRHGQIDKLLDAIKNWDELRLANAFTDTQKVRLKDPLTEWHLEKQDAQHFLLYPLYISKFFHCNLAEMQPGQPGGADWQWESPNESSYAIRLRINGDGKVKNPSFTTSRGVIKFPCTITNGQYLLYDFEGKAVVTDKNYNVIQNVTPQGRALLPSGQSVVSFSCEQDKDDDKPEVIIRYITRNAPEMIVKQ